MTGKTLTMALIVETLRHMQNAPDILIVDEAHMMKTPAPPEPDFVDFCAPVCTQRQPLKHLRPFKEKRKKR